MKKLFLIIGIVLVSSMAVDAQSCATGFCPATITVHHVAGPVSPTTGDITYNVISTTAFGSASGGYCLLDRNLGVTTLPTSVSDIPNGTGWYFQFGRKKGWADLAGVTAGLSTYTVAYATPSTNWSSANDPCTLLLGSSWRIPTQTEGVGFTTGTPTTLYTTWKMCLNYYMFEAGTGTSAIGSMIWVSNYFSATAGSVAYAGSATTTYASSSMNYNCGVPVRCIKNFAN